MEERASALFQSGGGGGYYALNESGEMEECAFQFVPVVGEKLNQVFFMRIERVS